MQRRGLGASGIRVSAIGLGCWGMSGSYGPADEAESVATLHHALDLGVNWIDTAAIYGLGHSEEMVAAALAAIPRNERPYVFTKCGLIPDLADRKALPKRVGERASIRRELEGSLRRLKVERIDLYQMHWPAEDGTPLEDYWQTLLDLKKEGMVRAVGLSNHNAKQLEAAEKLGHVDTLQPPFSAIRRGAAVAEIPWCGAHRTGVIVYSPMQSGLLTGSFSLERAAALPANDWRSRDPEFKGAALQRNLRVAEVMRDIAERRRTTTGAVAVAWTLAVSDRLAIGSNSSAPKLKLIEL